LANESYGDDNDNDEDDDDGSNNDLEEHASKGLDWPSMDASDERLYSLWESDDRALSSW